MSEHRNEPRHRHSATVIGAVVALPLLLALGSGDPLNAMGSVVGTGAQPRMAASTIHDEAAPDPTTLATAPNTAPPVATATPTTTPPARPSGPTAREKRAAARRKAALRAERLAKQRALPVVTTGVLGTVSAPAGVPVTGDIDVAVANIPNTRADAAWARAVGTLVAGAPDFVTLNEVYKHPDAGIAAVAPGYAVHRAPGPDTSRGASGQSMNNAVLYRDDTWTKVAGGIERIVDDDQGFLRGRAYVWDRFAVWSLLQRKDGAMVSVISTHLPTNPQRFPAQHGRPRLSRVEAFARGMDTVVAMADQLDTYGPVIVGGDMNSHPNQGSWTAAAKMSAAGYRYVKDQGVMYLFYAGNATVTASRQVRIESDHPALISTLAMNSTGPA